MSIVTGKDPIVVARHIKGTVEFIRSGAYANLNDLCKPFNKRLDNWTRLDSTKEIIDEFLHDPCYSGYKPIIAVRGRNLDPSDLRDLKLLGVESPRQGTWAHPDIAIECARWCNPRFALWCNRQIRHLLQYGEVNLHYTEWSKEEYERGLEYLREDREEMWGSRKD